VEHVLLCNADASPAGSDLAVFDARGQDHRAAHVADVWSLDLPSHVSVAGWEILQGRGDQRQVLATALAAVRCRAKRPSRLFSVERRLVAHYQVGHKTGSEAQGVRTAGPDHLWRHGSVLEQGCRTALP